MYNGLIIEDDPELSEIIATWCNECGIEKTHTCGNGAAAVELLQKTEYDIIILDHNLPGRKGLDILRQMRNEKLNNSALIYFISGDQNDSLNKGLKHLGVRSFLPKPFSFEELRLQISIDLNMIDRPHFLFCRKWVESAGVALLGNGVDISDAPGADPTGSPFARILMFGTTFFGVLSVSADDESIQAYTESFLSGIVPVDQNIFVTIRNELANRIGAHFRDAAMEDIPELQMRLGNPFTTSLEGLLISNGWQSRYRLS
jgi:CheY-like chemotaxis protein